MSKTFKIKPCDSTIKVLDPETMKPLSLKGEEKPRNEYWLRRLKEGSIIEIGTVTKKETAK
ncbi:MAG: DUF2635 domain-containing protein [Thiomicrospira sp.]|nr:MAG: DUF2635 domain-containing protein [Thiomicrospira sp.]